MDSTTTGGNGQSSGRRSPDWINVGRTERWSSVGAGTALALTGMRRGGISGALLVLSGGGLVLRGMTGHCYAYEGLGMSTAELEDELDVGDWQPSTAQAAADTRAFELRSTEEGIQGTPRQQGGDPGTSGGGGSDTTV
ncbi:MAG: DUF2892 domain-containing protein [Gemmatimonadota bacterium]